MYWGLVAPRPSSLKHLIVEVSITINVLPSNEKAVPEKGMRVAQHLKKGLRVARAFNWWVWPAWSAAAPTKTAGAEGEGGDGGGAGAGNCKSAGEAN